MLQEVLDTLKPADSEVYVDGTFGAGGYTKAFLDAANCTVIAIDRDRAAQERANILKAQYGERLIFIQGNFGDVESLLKSAGFEKVDGFVLDIGVSSMQIDQADRGFSFRGNGPLDMRMDQSQGRTAADIVNQSTEKDLADIIFQYGEERLSRKVARRIVERRKEQKFTTTSDLADVVRAAVPKSRDGIDPATRTFQALRIVVNDELGELERALNSAENILKPDGRLVVVSFHSLEDKIVKNKMKELSGAESGGSRYAPVRYQSRGELFELISRKAIAPSQEETRKNPRARSAKLRAARRTALPGGVL
jgi:16S rRNA (cytosine1402-N4)-methyltransferase